MTHYMQDCRYCRKGKHCVIGNKRYFTLANDIVFGMTNFCLFFCLRIIIWYSIKLKHSILIIIKIHYFYNKSLTTEATGQWKAFPTLCLERNQASTMWQFKWIKHQLWRSFKLMRYVQCASGRHQYAGRKMLNDHTGNLSGFLLKLRRRRKIESY